MPARRRSSPAVTDAALAELADAVLELARKLDVRRPEVRDVVPLTGTEVAVIRQIERTPRISPTQLATATGLQRSNVSTAIRSLEARGMVVREHPAGDGRAVELVATELATENIERLRAYWAQRLGQLDPALLIEGVAALDVLRRLGDALAE
ncbi:MarR family transcriptional regulator [Nocardioides cheoyonin]|uniref:MarR family transcriptional regulator n=1 Tax=Nocardioides cheoyonin TaxID=3156615 RepID=UPI0032B4FB03